MFNLIKESRFYSSQSEYDADTVTVICRIMGLVISKKDAISWLDGRAKSGAKAAIRNGTILLRNEDGEYFYFLTSRSLKEMCGKLEIILELGARASGSLKEEGFYEADIRDFVSYETAKNMYIGHHA